MSTNNVYGDNPNKLNIIEKKTRLFQICSPTLERIRKIIVVTLAASPNW